MIPIYSVLFDAYALLMTGVTECLFEALSKSAGSSWNGGFGIPGHQVHIIQNGYMRKMHGAYEAVYKVSGAPLMLFSIDHSLDDKLEILKKAMNACLHSSEP